MGSNPMVDLRLAKGMHTRVHTPTTPGAEPMPSPGFFGPMETEGQRRRDATFEPQNCLRLLRVPTTQSSAINGEVHVVFSYFNCRCPIVVIDVASRVLTMASKPL